MLQARETMSKFTSKLCLSALLGAALISSVQASDKPSAQGFNENNVQGEITYYTHKTDFVENGTYDKFVKEFKKLYPKVTDVKVIGFGEYRSLLRQRMNTNDYGDLVQTLTSIPANQYPNYYEPLNVLYTTDEIYFPDTWEYQGKRYGISIGNSLEGLVYNKTVFKEAGIEAPIKTISELYSACEKIKKLGKTPIFINFGTKWALQQFDKLPIVIEGNADVYDKMLTQKAPFSDKNSSFYKSLVILNHLVDNKYVEEDLITHQWEDSKNAFAKGQVGMMYLGNWVIPQIIDKGGESKDIGFMPMPGNDSGVLKAQMNHDFGYAISKHSKNKDTAKAFLKFLLEKSNFDELTGFIPTIKAKTTTLPQLQEYLSYNPVVLQTKPDNVKFIQAANKAKIDFNSGGYIQDLVTAEDFEKALEKLDNRWERAIKRLKK